MQSATQPTPKTIQGPAIFLAQFLGPEAPFNSLEAIAQIGPGGLGYQGRPAADPRCPDFRPRPGRRKPGLIASEVTGTLAAAGLALTELSTHLQGQLVAVHPAYDLLFDGFAPEACARQAAARRHGRWSSCRWRRAHRPISACGAHATFSGALAWPYLYPWPQRPPGLVETAFAELAQRWRPILDAFDEAGTDLCFELHPGEDLHDGATFERFLAGRRAIIRAATSSTIPAISCCSKWTISASSTSFHERIRAFHVKDAEFSPTAKSGVYGGFQSWLDRPGRFRSLGDGQIDFSGIFSRLTRYGFPGWAVLEWECCLKDPQQGAAEGAPFIEAHMIQATGKAFDDFAAADIIRRITGGCSD